MRRLSLVLAVTLCGATFHEARAQKPGDKVVVVRETKVKVGSSAVASIAAGEALEVHDVKDGLILISDLDTGWISSRDVAVPAKAVALFSEGIRKQPQNP